MGVRIRSLGRHFCGIVVLAERRNNRHGNSNLFIPFHKIYPVRIRVFSWQTEFWLVVDLPLWKIWKSVGMIIPNIWKNKNNIRNPISEENIFLRKQGQRQTTKGGTHWNLICHSSGAPGFVVLKSYGFWMFLNLMTGCESRFNPWFLANQCMLGIGWGMIWYDAIKIMKSIEHVFQQEVSKNVCTPNHGGLGIPQF